MSLGVHLVRAGAAVLASVAATMAVAAQAPERAASDEVRDIIVHWTATDGTPLEGKLSVPAGTNRLVPVVFYLHGAGPRNYDHPVRFRGADGQVHSVNYYDYFARELARRGLGFFRMSKRGCSLDSTGRSVVDRAVFSQATPTLQLDDYARALEVLRRHPGVDADRVVLFGSSEGTRLAPQLARRSTAGIVGLVLTSYASDNTHDIIVWQNSIGPWRGVTKLVPAAGDGTLTRREYDDALAREPVLAQRLPWAAIDVDTSGAVTAEELAAVVRPRLDAILRAVEERNDDFLWQAVVNLTSAYLRDGWDGEPTRTFLLVLDVPIGIFHGELDAATRVEGVRETEAAFRAARNTNLTVRIYPGYDHDLNWTPDLAGGLGPQPYQDAFAFAAGLVWRR